MKLLSRALVALTSLAATVSALSAAGWRSQSIYQVVTDRFARTDGSTTAACVAANGVYCGGSWQGIINHLDYIQNMGFTAVCSDIYFCVLSLLMHADLDLSRRGESVWEQLRWTIVPWILGPKYL
jgi:hypothetical protein